MVVVVEAEGGGGGGRGGSDVGRWERKKTGDDRAVGARTDGPRDKENRGQQLNCGQSAMNGQ